MNPTNLFTVPDGYKTYIVAAIAILTGIKTIMDGDLNAGLTMLLGGLSAMTIRHGLAKATTTVVVHATDDGSDSNIGDETGDPLHGRQNTQQRPPQRHSNLPSILLVAGLGCAALIICAGRCQAQTQAATPASLSRPACFNLGIGNGNGNGGNSGNAALLAAINAMVQGQQQLLQGQQQIIQLLIAMQHQQPVPAPIAVPVAPSLPIQSPPTIAYHIYMPRDGGGYAQPPLTIPAPPANPPLVIPAPPQQTPITIPPPPQQTPIVIPAPPQNPPIIIQPPQPPPLVIPAPGTNPTPIQIAPPNQAPLQIAPPAGPGTAPMVIPQPTPGTNSPQLIPAPKTPGAATGFQTYTHSSPPPAFSVDYPTKK